MAALGGRIDYDHRERSGISDRIQGREIDQRNRFEQKLAFKITRETYPLVYESINQ